MIYLFVDLLRTPLEEVSSQVDQIQRMLGTIRALHINEKVREDIPSATVEELGSKTKCVIFDNVSFYHGDSLILSNVSFQIAAGEFIGIVGPSGSGKSTIMDLICGLLSPASGKISMDVGVDHGGRSVERFDRIGVISQRTHIFAATVRDNITFFDDGISDDRIWEILQILVSRDGSRICQLGWIRV